MTLGASGVPYWDDLIEDNPKFVPGEEVQVIGFEQAGYNADRARVTNVVWSSSKDWKGWFYGTDHIREEYGFSEPSLVKLPRDEVTDWSTCAWAPMETK